ncbi:MAG: bifunctional 5,10-methylenetetrahydrofolate dehydrogenase/5,10-methenyltetrahydrofolate cyclohydrolase [Patescibacteria group bacterium]
MKLIDGRALAQDARAQLKKDIASSGLHPKLAVLLVGDDAASRLYVSLKEKAAAEVGIATEVVRVSAFTPTTELIDQINTWNADPSVSGILIQLPLPEGHDTQAVIAAMDPKKDADGFHPKNVEALLAGNGTIIPPLHEGILRLIGATDVVVNGAKAVIIANSEEFSKPLNYLLTKAGSFVTIMSPEDIDRKTLANAQIVVIAVGRTGFLKRGMVSAGTCIIDVGTNQNSDGKTTGDVDATSLQDLDGWLSPVPGGVGPMTIAMLLKNVFHLATLSSLPHLS